MSSAQVLLSARISIIGSGQLARMMAQEGIPMALSFTFLADPGEDTRCVDALGQVVFREAGMSAETIYDALGRPDVITVEKEHVDITLLEALARFCPVHPNPRALETLKNRRVEKQFLQSLNIPIAPYCKVSSPEDLIKAIDQLTAPVFLKTEEEGYDGYNQYKITADNQQEVLAQLEFPGSWVAEGFIAFDREVSFLAARALDGSIVDYPPVENLHRNGTLIRSLAPAPDMPPALVSTGQAYLRSILERLDYVGVICMECFVWQGTLLVNEIAPRVHNSGHWTSKGALTSQFENHVRAVAGLPLGNTSTHGVCGMLNLLGVTLSAQQATDASSYLTLYGKTLRARRKLGHITVAGEDYAAVNQRLDHLQALAYAE